MNQPQVYIAAETAPKPRDLIADLVADKRSENTKRAYRKDLADFFMTMTGKEATPELINQFMNMPRYDAVQVMLNYKSSMIERGLAEATINRRLAAVRSLVKYAKMIGACEWNLDDVSGEKVKKYRDTSGITVQQMNDMLNVPNRDVSKGKRDYALLRLFWELALRREEIVKLNVADFDPETCTLAVLGKGRGTQKESMTVTEKTKLAVLEWLSTRSDLKAGAPLFVTMDRAYAGKRMTGESLWKLIRTIAKAAGITKPLSPHKLRHSSITAALQATNGNVAKVQKLSRHSSIETVMIYEDHRVNQQKEVTDLLAGLA
jgi:integrase/recombinase XerC